MIYATVNMTIGDYSSTCDNKILLYRGDKNVEIRIVMKGNKFTVLDSTYAQMIIRRPSATSVFSEPAPIQNDTVIFVITEDMIDELKEIGEYTFQIRLYDDTMTARATLPPCKSALIIERPIAVEGEAAVNLAIVNDSAVMLADTTISEEDIFTEDNKYNRTIWVDGDLITDARLNKIEDALYYINENGGNGGGGGATAPYISTELPETVMVGSDENFDLHLFFNSPNIGKGTLRVFINDADVMSVKIDQGDSTTVVSSNLFAKGTNRVVVYVLDRVGVMSNSLVFYIRYGSTEISSDFDPYSAYDYGATIRYYFTPTALDTSLSLTFYMSIDGQVQQGVNCTSDTRGYYTFPTNLSADSHYCEAYVVDSKGVKSNVLSFNLIILDADTLVVASDTKEVSVEEGEQVSLDYKVYMKYNTTFIANIYVDDALVNTGTCNADFNYYKTSSLTKGIHTVKLEVFDVTETHSDYITWTVAVSDSTYEMLQPVNAGAMFIGTAVNKTNTDERKQYFIGHDQEGNEVLGTLSNFAYNSESGWVNDELIISGNSHVEIPVQPLANNAKYGFTLDIEFTSKQIGVPDAEVLTLWNDETNCGVKITTEKLILQSSNGNKCDLYFTDNERTHVMFVIDRQELKAKIYLNGVMCEAFHLNDYIVEGVAYLDDFTVNSNIILGGLNTNGYCKIRNLRVYQVALTTDEIMNNFISCEIDKAKQRELSEFQKGNDLPTLYVYCDFSGLGKDDKKPCKIVYNSTNEALYGKSFNLDHKQSQLQYQGTSSMAYPIKNYRLNLRDENGDKWYYTLPTAQPECRFTLKADFMSSGHWTNTGMAKFINDKLYNYNVNDEKSMNPFKWEHVQNGGKVTDFRETISGFPCRLILVNDGETPLNTGQNEPTPGNTKDMGIFNFNNDKDNVTTLGFNSDIFPNCASYEVTANSDTSAGAFMSYDGGKDVIQVDYYVQASDQQKISCYIPISVFKGQSIISTSGAYKQLTFYDENFVDLGTHGTTSTYTVPTDAVYFTIHWFTGDCVFTNITFRPGNSVGGLSLSALTYPNYNEADELAYLKESFELRHPDADDVAEDWGFMGIPGEEGTGLKALIDWVDNCTDEEFVRDFEEHFHKDYTLRYFCLVTLIGAVDNLGKNMMLDTADSKIFFPRFYDIDTICSYDNSGQLKFDVDIEMEQGYWNTSSSRLWTRIRDLMHDDIVTTYNNMRQNGVSYENMMKYIYDEQIAKIPQAYYNKDYDVKYAPFADSYIGMAHGDTYEHVKRWLKQRFAFVDTLFDYAPSYNNDILTIRVNTTEEITLHLETYTPVYQHLSWYNGQMDKKKIDGKTSITFSGKVQAATDQEVLIYGGSNIKKITGIQSGNPNRLILGSATKLTELDASNCPLLAEINMNKANLSPHEYLNKVNLSNCPLLEGNLRLNNSPLIQELDIRGTGITGMNLPSSIRNLQVLKLPNTMTELTLNDAGMLHTLEFDEGVALQSISMTNCNALTNVVNFDLLQTPSITLNNSYNNVAELYFRDTTNLALSNMSNLERVIFTPNNEYETFELINVANAPDYKVTTFNCPKLSTFMTTAPYRESYNDCGMTTITESTGTLVYEDFSPNGTMFSKDVPFDYYNDVIEAEIDLTNCDAGHTNENILSFATTEYALNTWGDTPSIHIYYTPSTKRLHFSHRGNGYTVNKIITDTIVIIKMDKGGIYLNNEIVLEGSIFESLFSPSTIILIGSKEGLVRSTALYKLVGVNYGEIDREVKDYGDIQPNTTFTANSIDISSTQFTDVKLLCTTDTNTLKLPTTVKNFYCDSSFDLDTDYLEDGEYDVVHGELVEQYTTDYEGEVEVYTYIEDKTIDVWEIGYSLNEIGVPTSNSGYKVSEYLKIKPGSRYKIPNMFKMVEFSDIGVFIKTNNSKEGLISDSTNYIRIVQAKDIGVSISYFSTKAPNLIPSSADGSLIFSMYAPNNTVAPASGTWDLHGLEFDNFHTFGMNNDVKPSEDSYVKAYNGKNLKIFQGGVYRNNPSGSVWMDNNQAYRRVLSPIYLPKGSHTYAYSNGNNSTMYYVTELNGSKTQSLEYGHIDITSEEGGYVHLTYITNDPNYPKPMEWIKIDDVYYMLKNVELITHDYGEYSVYDYIDGEVDSRETSMMLMDIKSLSMPARYDDYNIAIKNAYIKPTTHNTMLYPLLVNEDNPITGTLDYTDYAGKHLSWSFAYTDEEFVNIIQPKDELLNSYEYRYNAFYDTEYEFDNPYEIARYTTSVSGVLPGFNTGFTGYTTGETNNGDGTYTVSIATDSLDNLPTQISFTNKNNLLTVDKLNTSKVTTMFQMFRSCQNLTRINCRLDTSSVKDEVSQIFIGCSSLEYVDATNLVGSNIKYASSLFSGCALLNRIDGLDTWDTSNVIKMSSMFNACKNLTTLDVSGFDTSNVTDVGSMFRDCVNLTDVNVTGLCTSKITVLNEVFCGCFKLINIVGLNTWDTSSVTKLGEPGWQTTGIFQACESIESLDLTSWDLTNVVSFEAAFYYCKKLKTLKINFAGVRPTNFARVFGNCYELSTLEGIESIDMSNVTTLQYAFNNCRLLTSLNVSEWNTTSNATNMQGVFSDCSSLTSLNLSNWNTSGVTTMHGMFNGCRNLTHLDISGNYVKRSELDDVIRQINELRSDVDSLLQNNGGEVLYYNSIMPIENDGTVKGFNTSNVTNMTNMFSGCSNLTELDLSTFNTSKVTNMSNMFNGCSKLTSLDLSGFDTSKVTNISGFLYNCSALVDLTTNFILNKAQMNAFLYGCGSLEDLSNMKLSGTVTDIDGFAFAVKATSLDLSTLDCTYLTRGMDIYTFINSKIVEFYPPTNISQNIDFRHTTILSTNSIVRIFNNLITTTETRTVTLNTITVNNLTEEQIAIATNKGWTVTTP